MMSEPYNMPTLWHMYARALGPCMPSVTRGIRPYAPCHRLTSHGLRDQDTLRECMAPRYPIPHRYSSSARGLPRPAARARARAAASDGATEHGRVAVLTSVPEPLV